MILFQSVTFLVDELAVVSVNCWTGLARAELRRLEQLPNFEKSFDVRQRVAVENKGRTCRPSGQHLGDYLFGTFLIRFLRLC